AADRPRADALLEGTAGARRGLCRAGARARAAGSLGARVGAGAPGGRPAECADDGRRRGGFRRQHVRGPGGVLRGVAQHGGAGHVTSGLASCVPGCDRRGELRRGGSALGAAGRGGGAWLSDSNSRYSAVVAVLARVASGVQVGPFARVMGYHLSGPRGYFAPDRFTVLEGRVTADWRRARWGARVDGGAGSQQVLMGAAHQLEWHLGVTLTRGWGASNEIALVGLLTNSAVAIATGGARTEGFRYRTLGVRFQQGL